MEKTILEQERDIKDVIRRAKGIPDKTSSFRRDTLKRLIDLIHSPHSTLKILAAQHIRFFFSDFPELEEVAINAVYDLCEDQSPKVRIEGYTAITQVSKAENKWVKRNADVLLQLLQSDEPDEVIIVKKALAEHLDMDSRVTLGVICDQIIPPDEPMDDEELAIRDRLRSLVLAFLAGEAKRALVERHALPGSAAEEVLVNCLLEAIPKLGFNDVEIIVKNILISLTAYKPYSSRGHILFEVLLRKVALSIQSGLRSGNLTSLRTARLYLDLVNFLATEKKIVPAIQLFRFYCSHLSSKMTLQKFPPDDQVSIICNIAETLVASREDTVPRDDGLPLDVLRKQIVDACPFLFESLRKYGLPQQRSMDSCAKLLRICLRRRDETGWMPPPHLITVLNELQNTEVQADMQDVQILIRSLVSSTSKLPSLQENHANQDLPKYKQLSKIPNHHESPSTLGEPIMTRRIMVPPSGTQPQIEDTQLGGAVASRTNKHTLPLEDSSQPLKRRREWEDEDTEPSLLSRLGSSLSSKPILPMDLPAHLNSTAQTSPEFGYSIKGAAKMGIRTPPDARHAINAPSFSLLDRLEDSSSIQLDDGANGWKKKRGRIP